MILSYKFSKAWGLYFIWSLRTLTCVSAAMLLDSIEPSWQPETRVKFSSKTISHLRDFMGSGICSSWQRNMSGYVDVSVAMQVGLSNDASRNWIDPQSHEQPNETPTLINYILINWNGNFWQETLVLIFTKWDWLKRMTFVWDRHDQCCMLRD